jgi:hypothetical protein
MGRKSGPFVFLFLSGLRACRSVTEICESIRPFRLERLWAETGLIKLPPEVNDLKQAVYGKQRMQNIVGAASFDDGSPKGKCYRFSKSQ